MKQHNLSKDLKEVTILRVKAHIRMREFAYPESGKIAMTKLFSIEDNWGFWETIKRNEFWKFDVGNRLIRYYDAIQKWYNNYSKQKLKKDEWLCFSDLSWKKEKIEFNDLMGIK